MVRFEDKRNVNHYMVMLFDFGDCFIHDDRVYMLTNDNTNPCEAICLNDGYKEHFDGETLVMPVDLNISITNYTRKPLR